MGKDDCATSSSAVMLGAPKCMLEQELLLLCDAVWFVPQLSAQRSSSPPPTISSPLHLICTCSQRFSADLVSV